LTLRTAAATIEWSPADWPDGRPRIVVPQF